MLTLLVTGCDGNKKTADVSESKVMCSSTNDYEAGLASGLKVAPPCDITNNGTYKDKCVGEYKSTTWTNCFGERILPNGEKYRGGYLEGKANGKGEFINADGTRYLGYYEKGKRNGSGKEYNANGEVIKVGEWRNGVFSDVAQSEQNQTNTQAQQSVSQMDREEGACYGILNWQLQNKKEIGNSMQPFLKANNSRYMEVSKVARNCVNSQDQFIPQCLKEKLNSRDFDYFKGVNDAIKLLSSAPQDPKLMGNDTQMFFQFCYPLVKDSLK